MFRKAIPLNSTLLDIGCGPYPSLASPIKGAKFCCADISKENLHNIKRQKSKLHDLVLCDAELLPFRDFAFEGVISFGLLHHLPQPKNAAKEINRILRTKGVLIAHEPSSFWTGHMESLYEKGFNLDEINSILSNFSQTTISTRNHKKLEFVIQTTCYYFRPILPGRLIISIWLLAFNLEAILHKFGIRGTDFIIISRKYD
jgi:ubiquinone/menaquinone biosynthesis C-methylase UbiE